MANDMRYLSAEEEAKLLKPIDEYVGKIQAQIDALRVDGSDKVQALKTHISLTKEDKKNNKSLASDRVTNENVIGMLKRFKIIADKYRNRRKRFGLRFNLIVGLYNWELNE